MSFSRRFDRHSWYGLPNSTPSRTPSPPKPEYYDLPQSNVDEEVGQASTTAKKERRKSFIRRLSSTFIKLDERELSSVQEPMQPLKRTASESAKKSRRISGLFKPASGDADRPRPKSAVPAVPAMPKSFSTDRLPRSNLDSFPDRAAPVPKLVLSEKVLATGPTVLTRRRDELWTVFRALDGDYAKFSSKSIALKANVVRSSLMPFLKNYASHPSNRTLRPEDLDRRVNILNKWWTAMVEMLHGRNNQSISGTDRPVILDGIAGIMERPEWRSSPPFSPMRQRMQGSTPQSRSNTSFGSSTSDFLTESVHHNVRNIFIQNLSAQMALVVEKMSLRNASASLVAFCGKACAYAFMFVPGIADVLVRLWDLQMDTLRRVLEENGIGKFDHVAVSTQSVVADYPPALHQLGFTSLMKYMRKLRTPPALPLGTMHVQWWGRWLERWTGRESDLFYVFVKHFHILASEFLPSDSTKEERMSAPGMLLVHAQILMNLDATIHRDASPHQMDPTVAPSPTFDDMLGGADAIASALPVPPANATRLMAENRLIMLIRDYLSEKAAEHPDARNIFAESFSDLLQAAARGTSIFDHAACYTLLDFLEEALVILTRFESITRDGALVNTPFWLEVCRRMILSENVMTEIRLYGFLYTVWNSLAPDRTRKTDLCIGLLLDPEVFESRFNHWCPMVRAFYMRLLCWRVARFDGAPNFPDLCILETLWERLQDTWAYYIYMREQGEQGLDYHPSTAPCNPAPGRRLLIIRTDSQTNPNGSFLSFDGVVAQSSAQIQQNAWKRMSTISTMLDSDPVRNPPALDFEPEPREKGIGGFIRRMLGVSSSSRPRSSSQALPPRTQTAMSISSMPELRSRPISVTGPPTEDLSTYVRRRTSLIDMSLASSSAGTPSPATHRNFCFKFSLEFLAPSQPASPPPIYLLPPKLPMPAQVFLQSHSAKLRSPNYMRDVEPVGESAARARYAGRALAEWTVVLGECQSFFDRRLREGIPGDKFVETPTLGADVFKRMGGG